MMLWQSFHRQSYAHLINEINYFHRPLLREIMLRTGREGPFETTLKRIIKIYERREIILGLEISYSRWEEKRLRDEVKKPDEEIRTTSCFRQLKTLFKRIIGGYESESIDENYMSIIQNHQPLNPFQYQIQLALKYLP